MMVSLFPYKVQMTNRNTIDEPAELTQLGYYFSF